MSLPASLLLIFIAMNSEIGLWYSGSVHNRARIDAAEPEVFC
jgi:hypothetical protein